MAALHSDTTVTQWRELMGSSELVYGMAIISVVSFAALVVVVHYSCLQSKLNLMKDKMACLEETVNSLRREPDIASLALSDVDERDLIELAMSIRLAQRRIDRLAEKPYDDLPLDPSFCPSVLREQINGLWDEFQMKIASQLSGHNPLEEFHRLTRKWTELGTPAPVHHNNVGEE